MKASIILLAFGVAVSAAALPAGADILKGDRFIAAMKDNTVSGKTGDGTAYNEYFLPGGSATYTDAAGARVNGRWSLDSSGDVCVSWQRSVPIAEGCFRVTTDGRSVSWQQKSAQADATLRGSVTTTYLTR
ncbi:MAG TPA: hypothetical protein VMQ73_21270 [Methylomirabilota bacterium]|nr:hypothetical protein [Methylomirabilota bacterium]